MIDNYAGPDLLYYNSQGAIPEAAIVTKGQNRVNPFKEKRRFDATDFPPEKTLELEDDDAEEDKQEESIDKKELEEAEG